MKIILSLTILLLLVSNTFAQSPLTGRQVFDFDVGDEFQRRFISSSLNSTTLETVIGKYIPPSGDSVLYSFSTLSVIEYQFSSPYIVTDTIDVWYTDLDSAMLKTAMTPLTGSFIVYDTTLIQPSLNNRWITAYSEGSALESSDTQWGEGLGMVDASYRNWSYHSGDCEFLQYYKKGNEVWGSILSDTPEPTTNSVSIYPNPAQDHLKLDFNTDSPPGKVSYQVINLQGQEVMSDALPKDATIPIHHLAKGNYWLRIQVGESSLGFRFTKVSN